MTKEHESHEETIFEAGPHRRDAMIRRRDRHVDQRLQAGSHRPWSWRLGVGIPLACLLNACSPLGSLSTMQDPANAVYRLGPGDQLRVVTYNDPQMSNTFTVSDSGAIAFPLIGSMDAQGLTTDQLAAHLSDALTTRGILHRPSISVEVQEYRPIYVLGEVSHPGQYRYLPGMTMQAAIALAGGYTYRAITYAAGDVRTEGTPGGRPVQAKIGPRSLLEPGDVITVYERYF